MPLPLAGQAGESEGPSGWGTRPARWGRSSRSGPGAPGLGNPRTRSASAEVNYLGLK